MAARTNEPKNSDFLQQRLKAWQPILTPRWVILSFVIVAVIFVPVGFILKAASDKVVEVSLQYDGEGADPSASACALSSSSTTPVTCTVTLDVPEDMQPPVYVYYELDNFYQNHRRYVKSRDDNQLASGEVLPEGDLGSCDPLVTEGGLVLHPCGLIAQSFFNDDFTFPVGTPVDSSDIAWKTDREKKFKAVPAAERSANSMTHTFLQNKYPTLIGNEGVENQHFIVWMRVAALPKFRKLWGRIDTVVPKGSLSVTIDASFKVQSFEGRKSLVLSTTSWLGGKNAFLGIAYIVVGFMCLGLAIAFWVKQTISPRKPGDTQFLNWSPQS